nr:reverse transcriptase domain-containing protein [Tanacetum cinerariifolium]
MDENQTMAQLLQAPTDGYEDAIVIPKIVATNFELKHGRINLVQNKQFFGHEKEDPHAHLRYFNKITSTMRVSNVPNSTIKLKLFSFFARGGRPNLARKRTPSIHSNLGRSCIQIHQPVLPSFSKDLMNRFLKHGIASMICWHVHIMDFSTQTSSPSPALIKAVEPNCVTCGGNHAYQNCPATSGNIYQDNIQEYVSQAASANYDQGNTDFRPQMVANQIRPPRFPPVQNTQNNFNRGDNFNQNRGANFNQSNFNQSQLNQPQVNQPLAYQALTYQAPVSQTQGVSQNDFERYIK